MNKIMELEEFYESILKNKSVVDYDSYLVDLESINKKVICFRVTKVSTEQELYLKDANQINDFSEILSYWKRVNNSKRRLHYYDSNFGAMIINTKCDENPLDKFFRYRFNRVKKYLAYRIQRTLDRDIEKVLSRNEPDDCKPSKSFKL